MSSSAKIMLNLLLPILHGGESVEVRCGCIRVTAHAGLPFLLENNV
jgi:hypothetical protein